MRIDITSMFFNSKIEGKTATAAWGTSIGQNKSRGCRVDDYKQDVVDMIIGMTYKGISDWDNLDVSKGSSDRDIIKCAVFDDVYINNNKVDDAQYVLLLVREHSSSHEGRLLISYAPYITYKGIPNQDCIDLMQSLIGCTSDGCWFVYDISIKNQSELHFSAVVVNNTSPMVYKGTSKDRSEAWRAMIPSDDKGCKILSSFPLQTIFYGTPGSGKSHKVKGIVEEKYPNKEEQENFVFRTTFHPDSDYASFVGCYKPVMEGDVIKYKFTPQAFTKAYVTAWENQEQVVYLVIEEINRGNCAKIFGDLFQLLDRKDGVSEYPIDADNDLKDYLEKELGVGHDGIANGKLRLPSNLNILATMNTSDQSLFPMDSAFKRRWDWECVPVDYENVDSAKFLINIDGKDYLWHNFLKNVNARIKKATDSEDKQMGNFFITGNVTENQFVNKVMFYLWNDICKEEFGSLNNFFRNYIDEKKSETEEFSFNDLFTSDKKKLLSKFMEYIEVKSVADVKPEKSEEESE